MADFALVPYSSEQAAIWDNLVLSSKNGNFLQLRGYMDYHAHRFDERSLIVMYKGNPVAVFPCNRQAGSIISHSGLTYGGLIYGASLHAVQVIDIFKVLVEYYRELGCSTLCYKAIPHVYHRYPSEEDLYALFRLNAKLTRRDLSSVIPIRNRLKLSDLRKRKVRKAKKNGIEFAEESCFKEFHFLLTSVLSKFGSIPVHTLSELDFLKNRFQDKIRLFTASMNGQILAGAVMYDFGHVVHTQYLATSDLGRELGALDFVLSNLIEVVFSDRLYFSFGISTEQEGNYLNEGLVFQKEGFGARSLVHDFYELEL